jgi:hypothetical protein
VSSVPSGEGVEGLVLCRVGADRLAVRAHEITAFEVSDPTAPYAGAGFEPGSLAPADGKLLRHHQTALVVDSVEVHSERLPLLSVPPVLREAWGGALSGFVETGGLLWPVLSLERFARNPAAGAPPTPTRAGQ